MRSIGMQFVFKTAPVPMHQGYNTQYAFARLSDEVHFHPLSRWHQLGPATTLRVCCCSTSSALSVIMAPKLFRGELAAGTSICQTAFAAFDCRFCWDMQRYVCFSQGWHRLGTNVSSRRSTLGFKEATHFCRAQPTAAQPLRSTMCPT